MKVGYLDWEQLNHFYQKVVDAKEITLNDKISPIKNSIQDIQDAISILDGRVVALEITAADRYEIPKRPHRKLTIKVSA